jgi:hypothetical protein
VDAAHAQEIRAAHADIRQEVDRVARLGASKTKNTDVAALNEIRGRDYQHRLIRDGDLATRRAGTDDATLVQRVE